MEGLRDQWRANARALPRSLRSPLVALLALAIAITGTAPAFAEDSAESAPSLDRSGPVGQVSTPEADSSDAVVVLLRPARSTSAEVLSHEDARGVIEDLLLETATAQATRAGHPGGTAGSGAVVTGSEAQTVLTGDQRERLRQYEAQLKAQREAADAQATANKALEEALAALAQAFSTNTCHMVPDGNGGPGTISCPLDDTSSPAPTPAPTELPSPAPGSTIILPVGEVTLSEPLVFLEGVTVRGAGMDQTTLVSTAPGAAVIDVSGTRLVLEDLAVEVRAVASGIVTGPRAQLVLSSVRLTGAKLDADRTGGAGLHLVGPAPGSTQEPTPGSAEEGATGAPAGQTSVELTDCVIEDNAWAGIVVSGEHRVSIESTTVQESGEVGILFLDSASGSVADSSVLDSPLGIGVAGQATPVLVDLTISGGTVGVQLEGASAATIERLVVGGTEQAGVIITGEATGSLTDVTCEELDFGIVVADTAAPTVTDLDCTVARGS